MRVSYKWLSDYIDLTGVTAEELAEKLTRSGIEVDVVEQRNQGLSNIVVGEVLACEQHPNADKLRVCTVDAGQGEPLQIICGAPNVAAGQKVPVALVGATLPNLKIKKAKLRGVESHGMICSAKELGINDKLLSKEQQEGILVLPPETEIGSSIIAYLDLDDAVLELDLTPNRSDCLSMIGTAYEIAAILDREVKLPNADIAAAGDASSPSFQVSIKAEDLCSHYSARYIRDVEISPSPQWLQNRLIAAGIRPINNVVDVTNYVMLEYGQPLHAFDAAKLTGNAIQVRLAEEGEKVTSLDGVERTMNREMLLITDAEKPVAIAGVMGGADSEVTETTTDILLESARFSGDSVRKTSRVLGLRSESSLRFEKEVDPAGVIAALNRAASLLAQLANGKISSDIFEAGSASVSKVDIRLTLQKINRYLGTAMTSDEVSAIFNRLQFKYSFSDEAWVVDVPTRRGDMTRDVDLIEEIARLYGYDNIPTTWISGVTTPGSLTKQQEISREIRQYLSTLGMYEAIHYSFTHPDRIKQFPGLFKEAVPIALAMPMSEDRSVLRTSQVPNLIDAAVYNSNRNQPDVALYEIGSVYIATDSKLTDTPPEHKLLSGIWTGHAGSEHWSKSERQVDFYDVKGLLDGLFDRLGVRDVRYAASAVAGLHPGKTAEISIAAADGTIHQIGFVGQLHPELQENYDLAETYVFEIALAPVFEHAAPDIVYKPLPRYPAVGRDLAMVVTAELPAEQMVSLIKQEAGALLESVRLFDVYQGENVGPGKKSVAFSLTYRDPQRTLTDEEVSALHEKIVASLEKSFEAKLR